MSKAGDLAALIESGGRVIANLTANTTDDKAMAIVAGVRAIVGVMEAGAARSLSPEECRAALVELQLKLGANDEAADAKLRERFPEDDGGG